MSTQPRISIGMPAYNSAATIGVAIESLLAQSFGDFELIVSDNASTDATREIVEDLARRDRRIRYLRHNENIGANLNYTHAFAQSSGEFFKWSSSSDWCAPEFLAACLKSLEPKAEAVLAAPRTRLFEGEPSNYREYTHDVEILDATPSQRLQHLLQDLRLNNVMNGLIRSKALRTTRLIRPYFGADVVLMGHLTLLGAFLFVDAPLYYRRMEIATSTALQGADAVERHHFPKVSANVHFQVIKRYVGWFAAAADAPMAFKERLRVYRYISRMARWERHAFFADLLGAARYAAGGFSKG